MTPLNSKESPLPLMLSNVIVNLSWFSENAPQPSASCLIQDERHDTLLDALTRLIIGVHPLDGPRAIVRVDPAPGFVSMSSNDSLKHLNVTIVDGHVKNKNKNKNPFTKKAVCELEEELICQGPKLPVSEVGLAIATSRFNSRLRERMS